MTRAAAMDLFLLEAINKAKIHPVGPKLSHEIRIVLANNIPSISSVWVRTHIRLAINFMRDYDAGNELALVRAAYALGACAIARGNASYVFAVNALHRRLASEDADTEKWFSPARNGRAAITTGPNRIRN